MGKILIAEDDADILASMQMILEMEGFEVVTASDSKTLKNIHKVKPDLMLLDIWMSGVDGRTICRALKADKTTKRVPVVLVSASKDIEKSAKDSGADGFLAKPFEMDDLLKTVKKFLNPSGL
jgi:DNA-binding response OmpR family regulator